MISIDPGKHSGWAYWQDGQLVRCGLGFPTACPFDLAVIERPTVYPRSPVPPNDIVALAISAGMLAAHYPEVKWVLPRQWKGTAPKEVVLARVLGKLTAYERSLVPANAQHDVLDAIGLGLWYLKRMGTGGV